MYRGFGKNPETSKFEIYAHIEQLSLIGRYKVKGSVIILPVVGSGPANLTFGLWFFLNFRENIFKLVFVSFSCVFYLPKFFRLFLFLRIFADNVDVSLKFAPKVEIKKGKQYLRFDDVKLDFTTTR